MSTDIASAANFVFATYQHKCKCCQSAFNIVYRMDDFNKWFVFQKPIHKVLNYLSPEERQLVETGICQECEDHREQILPSIYY